MKTPDINQILRADMRHCGRGAPMGDSNRDERDEAEKHSARVYCQRVRFVDGDYGPDGTYWGGGRGTRPLWCIFTVYRAANGVVVDTPLRHYVRAVCRQSALAGYYQRDQRSPLVP